MQGKIKPGIIVGIIILAAFFAAPNGNSSSGKVLPLLPLPVKVERGTGTLALKSGTPLVLPSADPAWTAGAKVFAEKMKAYFNVSLPIFTMKEGEVICAPGQLAANSGAGLGCVPCPASLLVGPAIAACGLSAELPEGPVPAEEGYKLVVGKSVLLEAATPHAMHNGFMTLLQLTDSRQTPPSLPAVKITDFPRFRWRGMLLDPARHFLPVAVIKKYIDLLSELKLDVLHWHLTDDQGWRIEMKTLPRLHEVGGQGQFYTQDQIKDIVAYAAARQVMIVPEIDIPGHSSAILAAYPSLSCTGKPVRVAKGPGIYPTALCPGKEEVYLFLIELFGELATLFPAPYVHIGSDEVQAKDWLDAPANQKLMAEKGYKDRAGLQSFFVACVNDILKKNGKTMIAWDEITSYLPEGAVVQAWRNINYAKVAAEAGHDAIISPTSNNYIDYPQLTVTTLKKVYSFDPIPPGLDPKLYPRILGGEVNLWGERVVPDNIDRKAFPRLIAHAEVVWTPQPLRSWPDFVKRLNPLRADWKKRGVTFGKTWRDIFLLP